MDGSNGILDIIYEEKLNKDDKRHVIRWKRIVNRFKGKLIKMIKKALIVNLMIILFHLKLDKFYYIGVMN